MNDREVRRGAGIYSRSILKTYDLWVVGLSNSWAWRCPSKHMLTQYERLLGQRHLDVGPGTGWYLERSVNSVTDLWLMDLNDNSLKATADRLKPTVHSNCVSGNVLEPLPRSMDQFDSIGVNYLFHCIPGTWEEKGRAFDHLADRLTDDGVLFGASILGNGIDHNLGGRGLMTLYNRLGIFHNEHDDAGGLRTALQRSFKAVDVKIVGTVAVFSARRPRR